MKFQNGPLQNVFLLPMFQTVFPLPSARKLKLSVMILPENEEKNTKICLIKSHCCMIDEQTIVFEGSQTYTFCLGTYN